MSLIEMSILGLALTGNIVPSALVMLGLVFSISLWPRDLKLIPNQLKYQI